LGSLYAARVKESGNSVTILGRGKRLEEIRSQGILLEDQDWQRTCTRVDAIAELALRHIMIWQLSWCEKISLILSFLFFQPTRESQGLWDLAG
jgi:hypothetical protein